MNLEELKKTDWYKQRPLLIQKVINKFSPLDKYRFKETKKEFRIYSYEEPKSGKMEDVRITVKKTGEGGVLSEIGLGDLDINMVFDVKLTDIEKI